MKPSIIPETIPKGEKPDFLAASVSRTPSEINSVAFIKDVDDLGEVKFALVKTEFGRYAQLVKHSASETEFWISSHCPSIREEYQAAMAAYGLTHSDISWLHQDCANRSLRIGDPTGADGLIRL